MRRRSASHLVVAAAATLALVSAVPASAAPKFEFTEAWGGTGTLAEDHSENLCRKLHIKPGSYGHVHVLLVVVLGRVQVADPTRRNTFTEDGTLHCARPLDVPAKSAAPPPGHDLVRITCGSDEKAVRGGAGFHSTPRIRSAFGDFGPDLDGYTGFRWNNTNDSSAEVQFWAVCRRPA